MEDPTGTKRMLQLGIGIKSVEILDQTSMQLVMTQQGSIWDVHHAQPALACTPQPVQLYSYSVTLFVVH